MSHDDLIDRARTWTDPDTERDWDAWQALRALVNELADALESRPSLAVRGEEELRSAINALQRPHHVTEIGPDATDDYYLAHALIESDTVRVAPSLVAASREATIEHLVTIENDHWYDISESRNLGYYRTEITCACGAVL